MPSAPQPPHFWPDFDHIRRFFGHTYNGPNTYNCTVKKISAQACKAVNDDLAQCTFEVVTFTVSEDGGPQGRLRGSERLRPVRDHTYECVWDGYNSPTYMLNSCAATALPKSARTIYDEANRAFGANLLVFLGQKGRELYNTMGLKGLPAKFAVDFLVGTRYVYSMVHQDGPLRLASIICVTYGLKVVIMVPDTARGRAWAKKWQDVHLQEDILMSMAADARKAGGRVAHLYADSTGGRMCVIPAGWHHAAFNFRPTISLNITHAARIEELAEGLIDTAREYPEEEQSPMFGLGIYDLLACMVEHLRAMPNATFADQEEGLEALNVIMSALNGWYVKRFMAKGLTERRAARLRSKAFKAFACPPEQWLPTV